MSHFKTIESEMFGFDTIEKEVSTCENIFTSEHVEFGSDSVQMHRVSDTGFNANIDLRPRPRHLRHWGLVLIFDENIDFYDELLELNSAHLAVKRRVGNIIFLEGLFELERNQPMSLLIQFRSGLRGLARQTDISGVRDNTVR